MNERERNWLNQLFINNHKIMRNARQDVQDIKREMMTYLNHDIDYGDNYLNVHYVIGNEEDFGTKEFDLQDFYAWAKENCQDKAMWTKTEQVHFEGSDFITESVFDVESYVEQYEEQLVIEFFNKMK